MNDLKLVQIDDLIPSPTNPRKTFFKQSLMEMSESIKQIGIIQPPGVRKHKTEKGKYEIIYGERRTRAAKIAGLKVIQVLVKELDDAQVLDLQVTENLCREAVPPLEEAEVLKYYYDNKHFTVEEIALKMGCSVGRIYSRIKLNNLIDELKEMLNSGELNVSVAIFISSLPHDVQRSIIQTFNVDVNDNYIIPNLNEIRALIRKGFMLYLSDAIFDIKDENLVKAVGSCINCQFNTSCNKSLFPELERSARCVNRPCFDNKTITHAKIEHEAYKSKQDGIKDDYYYVSTEIQKSSALEKTFGKVYYANEYSFVPQKSANTKLALVVNDGMDYMNQRYIKIKHVGMVQTKIEVGEPKDEYSFKGELPKHDDIEYQYNQMIKSKRGELDGVVEQSLFERIKKLLKNHDFDNAIKVRIFALGKVNIIRSINILARFNYMSPIEDNGQFNKESLTTIWYGLVMGLGNDNTLLDEIQLILSIEWLDLENNVELGLFNSLKN